MRLAQAEVGAKVKHVGVVAGLFGAAELLAFFGLATAIATAIIALALVWPLWLAALAVTVVLLVIAGIMALVGKKQVKAAGTLKPERAMTSIEKDVTEIKEQASHEHS